MKITVKNIKGESHQIEVNATDKILDAQAQIQQKFNIEPENQKLIYKGRHLDPEKTIQEIGLADGETMIVMALKKYTTAQPTAEPLAQPKPQTAQPAFQHVPVPAPQVSPSQAPAFNPNPQPPAHPPAQPPQQLDPNNEIVYGAQHKIELIKELSEMGFSADQVEKSLVAAFFNKERAVDYLLNGIPANLQPHPPAHGQPGHPAQPPQPGQPAQPPQPPQPGLAPQPGQPQQIAITPQQLADIQQLVNNPEFQQISQQAMQNPQVITQLMIFLQQNKPELFHLFQQNPNLLVALLTGQLQNIGQQVGGIEDDEEEVAGGEPLTPQDMEAINEMKSLGFSDQVCIEAYLICDKNKEQAINYLLDQQAQNVNPPQPHNPNPPHH